MIFSLNSLLCWRHHSKIQMSVALIDCNTCETFLERHACKSTLTATAAEIGLCVISLIYFFAVLVFLAVSVESFQ